jgi:hypothetical protein
MAQAQAGAPPPGVVKLAEHLNRSSNTLLLLSPGLITKAAASAKLSLEEECDVEAWLATQRNGADEQAPGVLSVGGPLARSLEDTVTAPDGTRRAKTRLVGGAAFQTDFEKYALPNYANLPMRLDFSNTLVLTEPPMAIIAFVRGCSLADFITNLRLFMSPLMVPHETDYIEERLVKPLVETHTQIFHILKGVESCKTAKEWEDLVRVIDPTLRLIYGVWSEVFRKRRRSRLTAGETFSEESPTFGLWLVKVMKEYDKSHESKSDPGRGGRGGRGGAGGRGGRGGRGGGDGVCFRCGAKGHRSAVCPANMTEAEKSLAAAKETNPSLFKRHR